MGYKGDNILKVFIFSLLGSTLDVIVSMFLHKYAIKMKESGKLVKYGYAVFEDSNVAERLLQQGNLAIADGVAVKISPMV